MKQAFKILRRILPLIIIALTAYFFAKALVRNWHQVQEVSLRPNILSVTGVLLLMASVIISGILWGRVLDRLVPEKRIHILDAIRIHSASWLLKYIPGQAGSYLNKVSWGTKQGYSKKALTNSFIYENAFLLFASIVPTVPIILIALSEKIHGNVTVFAPLLVGLPVLIILSPKLFYWCVNTIFVKLRKQEISRDLFLDKKHLLSLQLEFILPRILNGAGFVCIVASLIHVPTSSYIPLGAIYVLAGIVGVLAIFVPSGLGVREAVIVLLASAYMSPHEAILVSIASRFYATIADLGLFGIYLVLNKGRLAQQ